MIINEIHRGNPSEKTIHVLIIGAGTMGRKHFHSYQKIKNVHVIGIVDLLAAELAQSDTKENLFFKTVDEALKQIPQVDVIDICLPTHLHKKFVEIAANHGKNIICEKPLANNVKDASDMITICEKNRVNLYVGHVVRFFPQYKTAKAWIDAGKVGETKDVFTYRNSPSPKSWKSWYRNHDKSGGFILDLLIHDIDFLLWCYGDVKRVFARKIDTLDRAEIILSFTNGLTARIEGGWSEKRFSTHFTIIGEHLKMIAKSRDNRLNIIDFNDEDRSTFWPEHGLFEHHPYVDELAHFITCIRENRKSPIISPEEAYQAVKVCLAAIESIKRNQAIFISDC